ncbi:MAG TPA: tetratricopeptide repeat protein [Gaiellaceae bacterium]|nr:tetratricopeptide repeat protein [Gaiellaceae bacterium]
MATAHEVSAELVSFVPRLTLEWLRDHPERTWLEVEGTLAFVDISGFTAMSERLSSRGRAGAEEVTEVMNATFAALLGVAYAQGGGLLKFGGDALLLLYDGDDHARRAARAAFEMRRTLRAVGRPRTSAGAVQLKMHAGLHSGRFHFFLVGGSHRELLVTGPAATRTVEMEAASEAGEILLSAEAAALVEDDALGEEKGPGLLLRTAPGARGVVQPLPAVEGIPLELAVPAPLRAQLLEVGPLEGEHRHAAIAFVRFSGTDEVIATEGPEAAAEALDVLVRAVQAAADEHRVTFLESDVDRDGGRLVLVSGAPQTFGDDEERLLRTVRAAVDAGLPVPVHVGVSEGRVFTGQVGASFRRTYTVLGDTAALAARLMARAGEDEIWVSADAFARGGARFAARELEPFAVKGKSEPVRAVVLGELVAAAEPTVEGAPRKLPFVDRERERAVLAASVAPVRMGFGTLVELVGEPGIGKSRLAEELREHCADMRQISLRCEQYEASSAYYPFRPFLRSLLDVELNGGAGHNRTALAERLRSIDEELVPWAPLLAAPLDVEVESTPEVDDLDPAFWRARLHGVMGKLLGELLDSPTLLLFEDVHWMDDASSELLRYLGTQLASRPWLTCTTRRPLAGGFAAAEGTPPLPALTLRLEPLPPDDARALAEAAAGGRRLTEEELAALMERAAGNPLFLQELASTGEAVAAEELPESVEALVAARIDQLAPGDRALLRWASVLGVSFSAQLIVEVLEDDPLVSAASEAWDRLGEFVERDPEVPGAFRFRHALIRDAAYEGLSFKRRRELHGRVAEVIERRHGERPEDAAELLSLHYHRAGRAEKAWTYSVAAGRRAQAKWANAEAVELYRRALDVSSEVAGLDRLELARVWQEVGDCLHLLGELEEAARAYTAARALTPKDAPEHVELMRKQGLLRDDMGRYADSLRWYTRGLKAAEAIADEAERRRLRIRLRLALAQTRYRQGAFRDCIRRFEEVVEESLAANDSASLAPAYLILHLVHTQLGSPERAAFRGLALALYEELGDLKGQAAALNNYGIDLYYEGEWDRALDAYERSRKLYERIGDVPDSVVLTNNIGEILSDQGRLEDADRLFDEVVRTCDAIGYRLLAAVARSNLGRSATRAGRHEDAQRWLEEAAAQLAEIGAAGFELEAEVRLAELDAFRGDRPEAALARLARVLESPSEDAAAMAPLVALAERLRGAALLQLGDAERAGASLAESVRIAREAEARYELALSLDLLGARGDVDAAEEAKGLLARLGVERVARPPLAPS